MDEPDVEDDEEYSLTESMIILKGECDLYCDADENGIRSELVNLFKTKLPFITNGDFDFVRRDRNIISSPVVKKEHVWDFKHVKHLCGTGRLYVRLNVSKDTLVEDEEGSITETPAPAPSTSLPSTSAEAGPSGLHAFSGFGDVSAISQNTTSDAGLSTVCSDDDENELRPSGAINSPLIDQEKVDNLTSIFPRIPRDVIESAVMTCGSLNSAVKVLLQYNAAGNDPVAIIDDDHTPEISSGPETLPQMLQRLRSKMQPRGTREKIKVDQDDLVMDVYSFYKSPDFDPTIPVFVLLKGQLAIDSGGVLRQVFSDVFYAMANNEGIKNVFNGDKNSKVPAFSNELVVNGLFEVLG